MIKMGILNICKYAVGAGVCIGLGYFWGYDNGLEKAESFREAMKVVGVEKPYRGMPVIYSPRQKDKKFFVMYEAQKLEPVNKESKEKIERQNLRDLLVE